MFGEVGGGSESDGTPSSLSENEAEDTLVEPRGNSGFLVADHTLTRGTPTSTRDELGVEANVSSTCSIPVTSGNGTTHLTFTLPELRIQPATDDEASSQVGVDHGTQEGGASSQVGVDHGTQEGGASTKVGVDHGTQEDRANSQVGVDHRMQEGGASTKVGVGKQEDVGKQQGVDEQEEVVVETQEVAADRPEEGAINEHASGGGGEDILAGTPSSSDLSSEAQQESLEEEPAGQTPVEGSLESSREAEEDASNMSVPPVVGAPPTSSLASVSSPVDTAAQKDLPQTSPPHTPLGSPPTTSQTPTSLPDSTVLVGDVSITTILGDLTLHRDPLLPTEQTPSFAHFTPGLILTKTGATQNTKQGNSREIPQSSAIRGSMGEYLKPLAGSSSAVTMATSTALGSASQHALTDTPPVSDGGGARLPGTQVHQPVGTELLTTTQSDRTMSVGAPSSPSATRASSLSYVRGARSVMSPPSSSAQLGAFLESLVAKYSPTRDTHATAPPLGDTPYPLQLESSGLPASTTSPPTNTPSLSRSLQTEFSAASRLSSTGMHTSTTVRAYETPAAGSTGGGSPLRQSLLSEVRGGSLDSKVGGGSPLKEYIGSNVGGGSPLRQHLGYRMGGGSPLKEYLGSTVGGGSPLKGYIGSTVGGGSPLKEYIGSTVGGGSPLKEYIGSTVGGGSPLRQHLGSSAGDHLSSLKTTSKRTVSPQTGRPGSSFSPPIVHVSPSKAVSPSKPSPQLLVGVPKSLVFPRVCCVGTSLEEKLTVVSHSDRWTESKLTVAEVYHNGEKVRVRGEGKRGAVVQSDRDDADLVCVCASPVGSDVRTHFYCVPSAAAVPPRARQD